jgi:lipid-A-disaccharide synthase
VVAGEASGDLYAARLLQELRRSAPAVTAFGMGGAELRAAGFEAIADSSAIAVMGLTEVIKVVPRARRIFRALLAEVDRRGTRAALLVDSPEFNLRLAKQLRRRGVKVVYYVSPQVWAWRRWRVKGIARVVDRMLVLFPFEVDFYRAAGVDVVHVGHPMVDEVPALPQAWDQESKTPVRVALLPGSREMEVRNLLPAMLAAVAILQRELPILPRLILAGSVSRELVAPMIAAAGVAVEIVAANRLPAIADAHVALCASGTATLEVGLLGTPLVVVYRVAPWTYRFGKLMVNLPYISLVNLVLGRRAVPELIQHQATPEGIAAAVRRLLAGGAAVTEMRGALGELRGRLGESGASARAAAATLETLGWGAGV